MRQGALFGQAVKTTTTSPFGQHAPAQDTQYQSKAKQAARQRMAARSLQPVLNELCRLNITTCNTKLRSFTKWVNTLGHGWIWRCALNQLIIWCCHFGSNFYKNVPCRLTVFRRPCAQRRALNAKNGRIRARPKNMLCMYRKWINRINVMHQNRKAAYHKFCVSVGLCALFPSALRALRPPNKKCISSFSNCSSYRCRAFLPREPGPMLFTYESVYQHEFDENSLARAKCAHSHSWSRTEFRVNIKCRHFNRSMNGYFQLNTFRLHNNSKNGSSAHSAIDINKKAAHYEVTASGIYFWHTITAYSDRFVV